MFTLFLSTKISNEKDTRGITKYRQKGTLIVPVLLQEIILQKFRNF